MKHYALGLVTGTLVAGAALVAAPAMAEDSMAKGVKTCSELQADYANGIAVSKKAAKAAVREGYRKPFVCKRVYRQLKALDSNRNGSVCERKA